MFHARKRTLVLRLNTALQAAAEVSVDLTALEQQERDVTGNHMASMFAWAELLPSTSLQESRLDLWRRAAIEFRLLDG